MAIRKGQADQSMSKTSKVSKTKSAKTPKSKSAAKTAKSPASEPRSSGRERKSTELFKIDVGERKARTPKKSEAPAKSPASSRSRSNKRKSGAKGKKSISKKRGATKKVEEEEEESDDEEYEIEKIVDHRIYGGYYVEYAVKWLGYPKEKVTWLDEFELQSAKKLLADYKFSITQKEDKDGAEYSVEKIITHRDVKGKRLYLVQWKGWENPVSHTELEEKELKNAPEVLNEYKAKLAKKGSPAGKKRGRPATSEPKSTKKAKTANGTKKVTKKTKKRVSKSPSPTPEQEEDGGSDDGHEDQGDNNRGDNGDDVEYQSDEDEPFIDLDGPADYSIRR